VAILGSILAHSEPLTLDNYISEYYRGLIWQAPWAFLVYWAVLGVSYAIDYRANLKEKELQASRLGNGDQPREA